VDKPSFEESLRALAARRPRGEDHPTLQELVAYRAGELSPEGDDRIQEHLTQCRDCAQLLLDLAEFEQYPQPPEEMGPVDARTEASWQRLRARLREGEERREEGEPVLLPRRIRVPLWRRPALPWALAAGLTFCSVGLWQHSGRQERRIEELSRPQAVRTVTLEAEDDGSRGADEERPVHAGEVVAYDLPLSSDPRAPVYPLYAVEIVPAADGAKPIPAGRHQADHGILSILLRSAPEAGDYYFQVSGIEGGRETPVGRYRFKVLPARL
jgi:Putative zinc-finger